MEVAGRERSFERQMILLPRGQRIELDDFQAKKVGQIVRKPGVGRHVVLIDQAGIERGHKRAAVLDIELEQVRFAARQQVQGRGENQFVLGEVFRGPGKVHRDVPVMQRIVVKLDVLALVEMLVGLHRLLLHSFSWL